MVANNSFQMITDDKLHTAENNTVAENNTAANNTAANGNMAAESKFCTVGTGYRIQIPQPKKRHFFQKITGWPILSVLVCSLIILGCIFAPLIANHDPTAFYLDSLNEAPNREFLFGTDSLGRDLFSILFYGGRTSISIGLLSAAIMAVIGIIYGSISGIAHSKVDSVMMRIAEMCGSIPTILIILILTAIFPAGNILNMSVVIGISGWFTLARIVRSEVRQIRNSDYVLYARCSGGGLLYVIWRHLVPNFLSAVMFILISNIGSAIMMESTLSFLGLGLPVEILSWGSMLSLAGKALLMNTWWVIVIPGVFLIVTLLCITNIGHFIRKETKRWSNL